MLHGVYTHTSLQRYVTLRPALSILFGSNASFDNINNINKYILKIKEPHPSQLHAAASARAATAVQRPDGGGAAACGNDAGQTVVRERLPSSLKLRNQRVSPDGHGVRLGWHPALSRAFAP